MLMEEKRVLADVFAGRGSLRFQEVKSGVTRQDFASSKPWACGNFLQMLHLLPFIVHHFDSQHFAILSHMAEPISNGTPATGEDVEMKEESAPEVCCSSSMHSLKHPDLCRLRSPASSRHKCKILQTLNHRLKQHRLLYLSTCRLSNHQLQQQHHLPIPHQQRGPARCLHSRPRNLTSQSRMAGQRGSISIRMSLHTYWRP